MSRSVRVRLVKLCLRVALLMLAMAKVAAAQSGPPSDYTHTIARIDRVAFISHHPACNPLAMGFDPLTWGGRGIRAPRITFYVGYPLLNTAIDRTLAAVHTPRVVRTTVVRYGLPLAPHVIQTWRGLAGGGLVTVNLYDVFHDFFDKQPLEFSEAAIVRKAMVEVPLSCFARP